MKGGRRLSYSHARISIGLFLSCGLISCIEVLSSAQDWQPPSDSQFQLWSALAGSADGSKIAADAEYGFVYTWRAMPNPQITRIGGQAMISRRAWASAANCFLQWGSDLSTSYWMPDANTPVLNSGTLGYEVLIPLSTGNQYYRLIRPQN
jgi:hypothetical protein